MRSSSTPAIRGPISIAAGAATDHPRPYAGAEPGGLGGDRRGGSPAHPSRHVLTNFVGGPLSGIRPEVYPLTLEDGDRVLLCSDGLNRMVDDAEVAKILAPRRPEGRVPGLVKRALARGGRDNVTVVVVRYSMPGDDPPAG